METARYEVTEQMLTSVLHELGKLNNRLDSMETRVKNLESLLQQVPVRTPEAEFPQFNYLPPELRHRIWELAIPRRKLLHYWHDDSHSINTPIERNNLPHIYKLAPPIVAQVCKESRAVALTSGCMYHLTRCFHNCIAVGFWTWFDAKHDILELGTPWTVGEENKSVSASELLARARHVLVHVKDVSSWVDKFFECAPALQNIYIQSAITEKAVRDTWDPAVVSEFFGSDSFIMVDTSKPKELDHAAQILARNPQGVSVPFLTHGLNDMETPVKRIFLALVKTHRMKRFSKEWALKVFRKAWCSKGELSKGECSFDICELDLKNTRDISSMPRIRFVYTWEFHENGPSLSIRSVVHPPMYEYHLIRSLCPRHPRDLDLEAEDDLPGGSDW